LYLQKRFEEIKKNAYVASVQYTYLQGVGYSGGNDHGIYGSVNKPSSKKGISNTREALMLVMDQVKILLENLQMVDPSIISLLHKAKDRVGVGSDLIATAEYVHDKYYFIRKYFPQFYVHKYDMYMYSNVRMAFNTPQEELLRESSNILYGEHQAMYPRDLQAENCVIVASC
jgi:hypothetical protein